MACLSLSSCGLINTALRLAPLALLLADEEGKGKDVHGSIELRGVQVEERGVHGIHLKDREISSSLASKH